MQTYTKEQKMQMLFNLKVKASNEFSRQNLAIEKKLKESNIELVEFINYCIQKEKP